MEIMGLDQTTSANQVLSLQVSDNEESPTNDLFVNRSLLEGTNLAINGTLTGAGSELGEPFTPCFPLHKNRMVEMAGTG